MYSWVFFSASLRWMSERASRKTFRFIYEKFHIASHFQSNQLFSHQCAQCFFSLLLFFSISSEAGYAFSSASTMKRRIEKLLSLRQSAPYLLFSCCFFFFFFKLMFIRKRNLNKFYRFLLFANVLLPYISLSRLEREKRRMKRRKKSEWQATESLHVCAVWYTREKSKAHRKEEGERERWRVQKKCALYFISSSIKRVATTSFQIM